MALSPSRFRILHFARDGRHTLTTPTTTIQWDVFCHVIDHWGDVGVCWRLACHLAAQGDDVRLWVDDTSALAWMAPQGASGVTVELWHQHTAWPEPAQVVIEAFGCQLPEAYIERMQARRVAGNAPVWINLEYLSAQAYVERSHALPSPQLAGPSAGLHKWFYYPGFTAATGGLLREPALLRRQAAFDANAWLAAQGLPAQDGRRRVSLFCYEHAPISTLIDTLAQEPSLLLVAPGGAARLVTQALGPSMRRGALQARLMPALTQTDFDHLLWSCDLNIVRGEDSFVRAQWAARPFIWHIYPQADGAHAQKLHAFNQRFLMHQQAPWATHYRTLSDAFNGLVDGPLTLPKQHPWQAHCEAWREALSSQEDLASALRRHALHWASTSR